MHITQTHHIALFTPNFEAMRQFYVETLGLQQVGAFAGRQIIFISTGSTAIELIERNEQLGPAKQGWGHFAFEVEDIDAVYAELTGKGIAFHVEPKLFPEEDPKVRIAFFKDPDGNELELVEPLGSRYP